METVLELHKVCILALKYEEVAEDLFPINSYAADMYFYNIKDTLRIM